MAGKIQDDRTPEEKAAAIGFMIAHDKALSGWGEAAAPLVVMPDKQSAQLYYDWLKKYNVKFKLRPYAGRFGFFFQ